MTDLFKGAIGLLICNDINYHLVKSPTGEYWTYDGEKAPNKRVWEIDDCPNGLRFYIKNKEITDNMSVEEAIIQIKEYILTNNLNI